MFDAKIELIVQERLIISSNIEHDGQSPTGIDASAGDVELELADRDSHTVDAKIAQTENTGAVADDGDLWGHRGIRREGAVVPDDGSEVGQVGEGEVETVGDTCIMMEVRIFDV
ncbi:hypothetical protein BC936DRAFT_150099 [Jimgerdemannia flammicorona]|uniref:Uncharacterized protein n=2 Tax=Jimgerdemannia flammicorona TaxID=994334 RepID=A0A433CZI7_9FUNG|nr:hypothetical protein BC936DRAFT_150099 [Jimgerdemannia flammicorona]RUS33066.1 hypothetical protein BC938DRAFT_473254 [Jimgerdemannia flammicorona]